MIDKEVGEKMITLSQNLIRMLEMALHGFGTMTEKSVQEVEKVKKEVQKSSSALADFLITKGVRGEKGSEWVKPFLSMSSSFDRMSYNIEGIADRLRRTVQEDIPFSDRAVTETTHIFQEVIGLLKNLPDLILTQNKLLAQQMEEKGKSILRMADHYSEEHEQRLIEGVCVPHSSPLYLDILFSLKGIVVQTVEMSEKIVTLSAKV